MKEDTGHGVDLLLHLHCQGGDLQHAQCTLHTVKKWSEAGSGTKCRKSRRLSVLLDIFQ